MKLRSAALSDIGKIRRKNEDRFLSEESLGIFGVADGIGGLPGGAEAAECTIQTIAKAAARLGVPTSQHLMSLVHLANDMVFELGQQLSPNLGIGTTLTFGIFRAGGVQIAHVGDSRCYVVRGDSITQLTEDHSVENEARFRRSRGELVYVSEQNRNALTRCVGQPTPPEVDVISRRLVEGERYLFVTDGVTRFVRETELADLIADNDAPEKALRAMVNLANARGGSDNSTAVMVVVDKVP